MTHHEQAMKRIADICAATVEQVQALRDAALAALVPEQPTPAPEPVLACTCDGTVHSPKAHEYPALGDNPTAGTVDEEPGVGAWAMANRAAEVIGQADPTAKRFGPDPMPQPADPAPDGDEVEALARVISTYRGTPADRIARAALAHALALLHARGYRQVGDGKVVVDRDDLDWLLRVSVSAVEAASERAVRYQRLRAALDTSGGAT